MNGLVFEKQVPVIVSDPQRADIACFIGFVARRKLPVTRSKRVQEWLCEQGGQEAQAIPDEVQDWLREQGVPVDWLIGQGWVGPPYGRPANDLKDLLNVPVPIDAWEVFDRLFAWEQRPLAAQQRIVSTGHALSAPKPMKRCGAIFVPIPHAQGAPQPMKRIGWAQPTEGMFVPTYPGTILGEDDRTDEIARQQHTVSTYLGAAVRSFFAQGGRKCYVVRVGNPWPLTASRAERLQQIPQLIPGYPERFDGSPLDRKEWRGIAHLFGLPEVSFVCLPDLPDAVGVEPQPIPLPDPPSREEQFVECSQAEPPPPADITMRWLQAPRCDEQGYRDWARALNRIANLLARWQREVQLVAAVPIPQARTWIERDLLGFLVHPPDGPLASPLSRDGLSSAFIQLVYPWVRTPGSSHLSEQVESPDAVLVGILARNALMRGLSAVRPIHTWRISWIFSHRWGESRCRHGTRIPPQYREYATRCGNGSRSLAPRRVGSCCCRM